MTIGGSADTVRASIKVRRLQSISLIDDSFDGKVVGEFAIRQPEWLDQPVAVDIDPTPSPPRALDEFRAMQRLDLNGFVSGTTVNASLAGAVQHRPTRVFPSQDPFREDHLWSWRLSLSTLPDALASLSSWNLPLGRAWLVAVTLIRGERSQHERPMHHDAIRRVLPRAGIRSVAAGGHGLHAENPGGFLEALTTAPA